MKPHLQHIFAVGLFVLVCMASPFVPSPLATLLGSAIALLIAGISLRAIFCTGQKRIFAIGFLVFSLSYIIGVSLVGDFAFHQLGGRLPTTHLLQNFVQPPLSNLPKIQIVGPEARMRYAHGSYFIPLGHLLIAVALGYCGGTYAQTLRHVTTHSPPITNGSNVTA